ncbi:hypothetical protein CALVIDRAFT_489483, partial [Calocera viscosa TUFC12733]
MVAKTYVGDPRDVVVKGECIPTLLSAFRYFTKGSLRVLCAYCHVGADTERWTRDRLRIDVSLGFCGCSVCVGVVCVFRVRPRHRHAKRIVVGAAAVSHAGETYVERGDRSSQPVCLDIRDKRSIIDEARSSLSVVSHCSFPCAVCSTTCSVSGSIRYPVDELDLSLLTNENIPPYLAPTGYDWEAYGRAFLDCRSMDVLERPGGSLRVCVACSSSLHRGRRPEFAICNGYYFAYNRVSSLVRRAFDDASVFELMLVSRVRGNTITYKYSERGGNVDSGKARSLSQSYGRGNVMVLPQDSLTLNRVLPPPPDEVGKSVVVLFSGHARITDVEVRKIRPVLVRPAVVRTLIDFLLRYNPAYSSSECGFDGPTTFDQANLDFLQPAQDGFVPPSVSVGRFETSDVVEGVKTGYVEESSGERSDVLINSVGWTESDATNSGYDSMKLSALTWCLQGRSFLRSQAGNIPVRDFDSFHLLTWMWPKLDPYGLSGFGLDAHMNPVDMSRQVKHLISLYDSPFASDPTFAFVCHNIIQKRAVVNSIRFRVRLSDKDRLIHEICNISKVDVDAFERRSRQDPHCRPVSGEERKIMHLLKGLNMCVHDLPGTAGYKTRCRNEIRSLCNTLSTPALYITINPFDRGHPLVRLFSGVKVTVEDALKGDGDGNGFHRTLLVARNPVAAARFFHVVITSFIHTILRYGRDGPGLFG